MKIGLNSGFGFGFDFWFFYWLLIKQRCSFPRPLNTAFGQLNKTFKLLYPNPFPSPLFSPLSQNDSFESVPEVVGRPQIGWSKVCSGSLSQNKPFDFRVSFGRVHFMDLSPGAYLVWRKKVGSEERAGFWLLKGISMREVPVRHVFK